MLLAIGLLGLFFPQMMLVAVAMLMVQLVQVDRWPFRFTGDRRRWKCAALSLILDTIVVIPFFLNLSDYGATITAEQIANTHGSAKFSLENLSSDRE